MHISCEGAHPLSIFWTFYNIVNHSEILYGQERRFTLKRAPKVAIYGIFQCNVYLFGKGGQMGSNRAKQSQKGPKRAKWGKTGPNGSKQGKIGLNRANLDHIWPTSANWG